MYVKVFSDVKFIFLVFKVKNATDTLMFYHSELIWFSVNDVLFV
jgi:hypothetical protein